ncbi:MAG: hypothetical protein A2381_19510 [Bdellovibrionales bacterium RIFOXYB1_FULL_37_110]|nr:MAG: hypothetical protein A2417_11010 [Bdellovibrionales bacterium RIFOXYC1_FULL_37_79]OFZ60668.1 MAG: hypothetical protein A2381_19510 [Bdellovibrionales bacterium RIFOXYB1_FULL_37_110]OFZ64420.1 MAG: hypothetical protein A2577_10160 [Bdellovibrionales bacterium RIFOXYD1_FULL_36_51]
MIKTCQSLSTGFDRSFQKEIMKHLTISIVFFYCFCICGNATYNFSLNLQDKKLDSKIKYYFLMMENSISSGIRLGTNKIINIEFEKFTDNHLTLNCHEDNLSNFSYPDLNSLTVYVNQDVLELIESDFISQRNKDCSYTDLLVKSLERSILTFKNASDLSTPYSKERKKQVNRCRLDVLDNSQNGVYQPTIAGCQELIDYDNKKIKYKRIQAVYKKKLFYSTKASKIVVDPSSLTKDGLLKFNVCSQSYQPDLYTSTNLPVKILGFAIVYMTPAFNSSQFGHVAERYIYCVENRMVDTLYEFSQFRPINLNDFKIRYREDLNFLPQDSNQLSPSDETFLISLLKKNYIQTQSNPASYQGYGKMQLENNRDIIEVWLDIDPLLIYKNYLISLRLYKKQKELIKTRNLVDWPDYDLFNNNCTHPVREKLNYIGGELSIDNFDGFLPSFIYNFLKKKKVDKIIFYPAQKTLRQYQMLNIGKSLNFENITFLSSSIDQGQNKFMLIQPDFQGYIGFFLNRGAGMVNFFSALMETTWGLVTSPASLFNNSKELGVNSIKKGLKNSLFSLSEFFGIVRMRYPEPTTITPNEMDYLLNILPHKEPAVLGYLYSKF